MKNGVTRIYLQALCKEVKGRQGFLLFRKKIELAEAAATEIPLLYEYIDQLQMTLDRWRKEKEK